MSEVKKIWIPHKLESKPIFLFKNTNMDVGQSGLTEAINYPEGFVLGDFKSINVVFIQKRKGTTNFKPYENVLQSKTVFLPPLHILHNQTLTKYQIELDFFTPYYGLLKLPHLDIDSQTVTEFQTELENFTSNYRLYWMVMPNYRLYWMSRQIHFNERSFSFGNCQTNHDREIRLDNDCCIIHSIIAYV